MKNLFRIMGCFLLVLAGFQACNRANEIEEEPTWTPDEEDVSLNTAEVDVTYDGNAVILGVSGNDAAHVMESLSKLVPNTQQTIDENTTLLIVPELSDAYEEQLLAMYEQDGVIAILNPTESNLDSWYIKHQWPECEHSGDVQDALIYSFSSTHHCIVTKPNDDDIHLDDDDDAGVIGDDDYFFDHLVDDVEPEDLLEDENYEEDIDEDYELDSSYEEDTYNDMYTYLHTWITHLNEDLEDAEALQVAALTTRADDAPDVSKLFYSYPYGKTYPFSVNAKVRKWGAYKADRIKGNGSIGVSFDIYQIHCYEDQPGEGDYYLVEMTASVANKDMYKGKWWNNHLGTYIRICGLYGMAFEIECAPVDPETKELLSTDEVSFTAGGFPVPATVVGATSYDKSYSHELGVGVSVSGKYTNKGKGKTEKGIEVGLDFTNTWTWSKSESRTISDTDISNNTIDNRASYLLTFNQLPKYKWSEHRGFDEGVSRTYRSTAEIRSSWIWHVKDAEDDSNESPIMIRFRAKPTYGAMSFVTTKDDLKKVTFDNLGNVEDYIELKPFIRERCGKITLKNDFKNNTSIKQASLYKVDKDTKEEELIWETKTTIKPGNEVTAPDAYRIADDYMVRFTTSDDREYEYSAFDVITIALGENKVVYAATDFTQVQ